MKLRFVIVCSFLTIAGAVIDYYRLDRIAVAALPPNAWAGDGVGLMIADIDGIFQGGGLGLLLGLVVCFFWCWWLSKRRQKVPLDVPLDDIVWPPPPTGKATPGVTPE